MFLSLFHSASCPYCCKGFHHLYIKSHEGSILYSIPDKLYVVTSVDVKQHGKKKKEKHLGSSLGRGGCIPPLTSAWVCVFMCVCVCVYVCVCVCVCVCV